MRRMPVLTLFAAGAGMLLVGCMPKMTIEDMKAMIPPRPAELDQLQAFVGTWTSNGEAHMAGLDQAIKTGGTAEMNWGEGKAFLVGKGNMTMEGFDPMHSIETWTYDAKAKKYRSTWTDSMGGTGTGVATFNPDTNTWKMTATSYGPFGKSTGKGTVHFVDGNTMEWTWAEYAMGGLMKTMEMSGTNRRQ